jgi:hypothetical protein
MPKNIDPVPLWTALESYYDTTLNRANVVLFALRSLFNLKLDGNVTATKFISDFRGCLQRLRKNNAKLADDNETLRAFLLVAIQDDDFDNVRDAIVQKPDSSVETVLTEIRERDTALMLLKNQGSHVSGDGTNSTRYSRRANTQGGSTTGGTGGSYRTKQQYQKGRAGTDNRNGGAGTARQWSIPRFPDSWKQGFGPALFKMLLDWRGAAHSGQTQKQLDTDFTTVVERVRPGKTAQ